MDKQMYITFTEYINSETMREHIERLIDTEAFAPTAEEMLTITNRSAKSLADKRDFVMALLDNVEDKEAAQALRNSYEMFLEPPESVELRYVEVNTSAVNWMSWGGFALINTPTGWVNRLETDDICIEIVDYGVAYVRIKSIGYAGEFMRRKGMRQINAGAFSVKESGETCYIGEVSLFDGQIYGFKTGDPSADRLLNATVHIPLPFSVGDKITPFWDKYHSDNECCIVTDTASHYGICGDLCGVRVENWNSYLCRLCRLGTSDDELAYASDEFSDKSIAMLDAEIIQKGDFNHQLGYVQDYMHGLFMDMLDCIPSKTLRKHFEHEYNFSGFRPSPEEMLCIAFNSACSFMKKYDFVEKLVPVISDRQAAIHIQKIMEDLLYFDDERMMLVPEGEEQEYNAELFPDDEEDWEEENEFFIEEGSEQWDDEDFDELDDFFDIGNSDIKNMPTFADIPEVQFGGYSDSSSLDDFSYCSFEDIRNKILDGAVHHRRAVLLERGASSDYDAVALVNFDNAGEIKTFMPYDYRAGELLSGIAEFSCPFGEGDIVYETYEPERKYVICRVIQEDPDVGFDCIEAMPLTDSDEPQIPVLLNITAIELDESFSD